MKEFNYKYHSKRGKKIWVLAHIDIGEFGIQVMIELNIIDNKNQINWINDRRLGNENLVNEIEIISNQELIENAIQYVERKGYLKDIKEKYNK